MSEEIFNPRLRWAVKNNCEEQMADRLEDYFPRRQKPFLLKDVKPPEGENKTKTLFRNTARRIIDPKQRGQLTLRYCFELIEKGWQLEVFNYGYGIKGKNATAETLISIFTDQLKRRNFSAEKLHELLRASFPSDG